MSFIPTFQAEFQEDLNYWTEIDRKTARRILDLIEATLSDPFSGPGRPEPLKYLGAGVWSRRITQEHRLVYVVGTDRIDFLQARYHYEQIGSVRPLSAAGFLRSLQQFELGYGDYTAERQQQLGRYTLDELLAEINQSESPAPSKMEDK